MTPPPASLIIVSRHRKAALMRALVAVAQMDHPSFEVIVVADPEAACAVRESGLRLKLAEFDQPNISAARNIGLALASAPVVAFLDDDAVPEPTWLSRLVAPFADPRVTAAGGFVLGRSGLSWQWRAAWVDGDGFDTAFDAPPGVSLHQGCGERAIKTQGTNCAFRRDDLLAIGGFDPGFAFYLDEADVNLRLASKGGLTAVVSEAVVHHGYAASARRRADRAPTDITQIGHSLARFTARHGLKTTALERHISGQRARLLQHMLTGALEPRDVRNLMAGLENGIASAQVAEARPQRRLTAITPTILPFIALPGTRPRTGRFLFGTASEREELQAVARDAVAQGEIVTVITLSRGLRPHRHTFNAAGWWEQSGGRFGRSFRGVTRFNWQNADARRAEEAARLSHYRSLEPKNLEN